MELKRGKKISPCCRKELHWNQFQGMRLTREVKTPQGKSSYEVYDAVCPKCDKLYSVKK